MSSELALIDPDYHPTTGRQAINRINHNKVFHPELPTYKDHIGAALDKGPNRAEFYVHLGINEKFIAGGFYHPSSDLLKLIRDAIDYDGYYLKEIISEPTFQQYFGDIWREDALKNSPKDFSKDHEHIDLLKLKSFVVTRDLTLSQIKSKDFMKDIVKTYQAMLPFRQYLNKAVSFEE